MAVIKVGNNNIGKISVIEPYDNPSTNPSSSRDLDTSVERPSGWLEMPPLQDGVVDVLTYVPSGNKDFGVGVFARNGVYNNCPTHIPIDWGDGHSGLLYGTRTDNGNYAGNFGTQYKKYDYDLLPENTEIEVNGWPCRQVLIRIDGTVSGITYFNLEKMAGHQFGNSAEYGEADHYYDENNVKVYHPYRNDGYTKRSQTSPILEISASGSSINDLWIQSSDTSRGRLRNTQRVTLNVESFNPYYQFTNMGDLRHVEFPSGATAGRTDFKYMFNVCSRIKNLPFFDTSSATGLYAMFSNCHSIETVPEYDFSNVIDFGHVFHRCVSLKEIPEIDFSNGKNFYQSFSYNHSLLSMPSGFSMASATGAYYTFSYNYNMKYLPELDCPNLTDIRGICYQTRSLESHTLNVPSAYNVEYAFYVSSIKKLTIKALGSPTSFLRFIRSCYNLKEIDWKNSYQDTANATNFQEAFAYNNCITRYPEINTALATNCNSIMRGNYLLQKPPVLDFSLTTDARHALRDNYNMTEANFSGFNRCNAENMFASCSHLTRVSGIFEDYETNPTYYRSMFYKCYYLEDVSHFVVSGSTNTSSNNNRMFYDCQRLRNPPKTINTERGCRYMFERNYSLESVEYDLSASLDNSAMFNHAQSLKNAHLSGVKASIGFYQCQLGSGNITEIFNGLENVSSASIDLRGNYGIYHLHQDTLAIATNKGWTVTT